MVELQRNRRILSALGLSLAVACSTTNSATEKTPEPPTKSEKVEAASPAKPTQSAPKTELASGELREAILLLKRVHFSKDTSTLLPESVQALGDAAAKLKSYPDVAISIDGHADARGTVEYNIALGQRRAETVYSHLEKLGIASSRLTVVSFGEERPLASGGDAKALSENRRVEFRLTRGSVQLVLEDGIQFDDKGNVIASTSS